MNDENGAVYDDIFNEIVRGIINNNRRARSCGDEFKDASKDLYSHLQILMHAGFTREEAYGLLITILEGAFNNQ